MRYLLHSPIYPANYTGSLMTRILNDYVSEKLHVIFQTYFGSISTIIRLDLLSIFRILIVAPCIYYIRDIRVRAHT